MFTRVVSAAALVFATVVVCAQTPRRITIQEGQPPPVKLTTVAPIYPEEAKREKISGTVYLDIVIATNGSVSEASVLRGVHPSLNDAAIQAVGKWKYKPTTVDDEPVEVALTVSVQFVLPKE
jgi:TonB family protein